MRRTVVVLSGVFVFFSAVAFTAFAQFPNPNPRAGKNQTDGFIWEYTGQEVVDQKLTGKKMSGHFRVSNLVAYKGPKRIGFVRPERASKTTLTITDWPELNGTATLTKTGYQPPIWQGGFRKADGTKWRWSVKFVKN